MFPEPVMDSVRPNFNHHEEIPGFVLNEVFCHRKSLLCHLVDLCEQVVFIVSSEIVYIEDVVAHQPFHFFLQLGWVGVLTAGVRG